jgi:hypothetical protein
MHPEKRWLPFFLITISLIALIVLAGGLSQLSLRPSTMQSIPFRLSFLAEQEASITPLPPLVTLIRDVIILLTIAILPFAIIYVIFSREAKTRVLRYFLLIMMNTAVFIILLPRIRPAELDSLELPPATDLAATPGNLLDQASEISLPDGILYGLVFILLATSLISAWYVINRARRRQRATRSAIARNAQAAIREVKSGRTFEDIVIRCYYEMCRTLDSQFGLERHFGTTPREFEAQCVKLGLPKQAVVTLTRLFEEIRYGGRVTDPDDQQEALDCLQVIAEAGA